MAAIAADESQLEDLAKTYADKSITLREWLSARKIIEGRLEAAWARLSRHDRHRAIRHVAGRSSELRTRWPGLNLDQRRAIIGGLLDRITVRPATVNRFDPERLEPVWRI